MTKLVENLNHARSLMRMEKYDDAIAYLRVILAGSPKSADAHFVLGEALVAKGCLQDACECYLVAVELDPQRIEAAKSLASTLYRLGLFEQAVAVQTHCWHLRPSDPEILFGLGKAQLGACKYRDARATYELLLKLLPDSALARADYAEIIANCGDTEKSLTEFGAALGMQPDDAWLHFVYSKALLRQGLYGLGWEHYEYRHTADRYNPEARQRQFHKPLWQGESLCGKVLLLVTEQGLGDEIMFASLITEIMIEAKHVVLECDIRLEGLFRRSFPGATLFAVDRSQTDWQTKFCRNYPDLDQIDCWSFVGSLPRFRRKTIADFPRNGGYLKADQSRIQFWREKLDSLGSGNKIGISWRGGTKFTRGDARSLTLDQLRGVLSLPGAQFVNLQYGQSDDERAEFEMRSGIRIHHWRNAIDDYDETAALVSALDLVVSVCTSVVHLSGALGRPVWVMAPFLAEWRYGAHGRDMHWYSSARVYRQHAAGDWESLLRSITRDLSETISVSM